MTDNREMLREAVRDDSGELAVAALLSGATPLDIITFSHPGLGTCSAEAWFAAAVTGAARAMSAMLAGSSLLLDARDDEGETALHWAALYAQPEVVKLLLAAGADPYVESSGGFTPLRMEVLRVARGVYDLTADREAVVRSLLADAAAESRTRMR